MPKKVYAPGLVVLLSTICLTSIASAQTSWWRTYGGPSGDAGCSVQQTTDSGYVITGYTFSFGSGIPAYNNVYLIKTNASGETLWTRTYGGTDYDGGSSVRQTSDGGYIIAGHTNSFGCVNHDVYLIKTKASGETLWTRTYGGTGADYGESVQQTADGYIVAGFTSSFGAGNSSVYLIKTDSLGDTLWTKTYGGEDDEFGHSIQQTSDGGYIIAGHTGPSGSGDRDVYLVKTTALGETLWTRTYGGADDDEGNSVRQTSDGGYVVTGVTYPFETGIGDIYLIKTNAQGDTLWTKTYGGTDDDVGNSVGQTADSGFIIAGYTGPFGMGNQDVYLIKTNAQGDTLWTKTYGGTDSDAGYAVQQVNDGGYVIAGTTYSFGAGYCDVYLIKTDANGNVGIEEPLTKQPARHTRFLVQPNPFTSFARVPGHETELFTLSDVTGRQVAVCKGDRVGEGLRPGVYFLSPVGLRAGTAATATIVKVAF